MLIHFEHFLFYILFKIIYIRIIFVGDAVGEQHENAQKLFRNFWRAERRHGWRDHGVHFARVFRLLEVR